MTFDLKYANNIKTLLFLELCLQGKWLKYRPVVIIILVRGKSKQGDTKPWKRARKISDVAFLSILDMIWTIKKKLLSCLCFLHISVHGDVGS